MKGVKKRKYSDLHGLAGWMGAVIFIPTLALALGVFSAGSRVFEVVYLFVSAVLLLLSATWRGRQVRV